mmetsp:Transcript_12834/g.40492  ORF Transcript_12834/g.40492 Transcript_12834/m.40492 type:complete len:385 (+) Transcript_12834:121-1275(+)
MATALSLEFWLCMFNLMMSLGISVHLYEAFVYNVIFLGQVLPALGRESLTVPFRAIFNLVWGLALWSHLQAHFTDPGIVPQQWQEFVHNLGAAIPIAPSRQEFQPGKATFCKSCRRSRPERAHHCQFCGACVLRYDHHCPWISNCVGSNNHKYFLLSVLYGCLASLVALATALPELAYCVRALAASGGGTDELAPLALPAVIAFLGFGLVALLVAILLTMLLTTYLPFAAQNLTTVEEAYTNMANPFDLGGARANLEQIFGSLGPDWLLPVKPFRPQTDGVFFPRAVERIGPGLLELRDSAAALGAAEAPLAASTTEMPARSSSRGGVSDFIVQDWSISAEDEVAVERLWRIRYHVGARAIGTAPPAKKRRWVGCCTRPGPGDQ